MEDKKQNQMSEWGKSFILSFVPITVARVILVSGFHVSNAIFNTAIMIGIIGIIHLLRSLIKGPKNNDLPIFLLILIFFPAGLYHLWKYSKRSEKFKVIVTAVVAGIIAFGKIVAG